LLNPLPENTKRKYFLSRLYGTQIGEAMHILHYLHVAMKQKGEVCEFGCANGATSALLANEIKDTRKDLWLYDSFQGLSKPTKEDELKDDIFGLKFMDKYEGTMSYAITEVASRLKEVKIPKRRVTIIPGFINGSIEKLPKKICFAYIDFDLYAPIIATLMSINGRIPRGGFIIVDDYGFFSTGVKTAVQEFLKANRAQYKLHLPKKFAGHFCILEKIKS
jgi:O-methyltransferase